MVKCEATLGDLLKSCSRIYQIVASGQPLPHYDWCVSLISSRQRLIQFRLRFLTSGRAIWFNERQESLFGSGWYGQGIPSNSETG